MARYKRKNGQRVLMTQKEIDDEAAAMLLPPSPSKKTDMQKIMQLLKKKGLVTQKDLDGM